MKYSEFKIKVSRNRKKDEENCRTWLKSKTRFQFQVKGKRNSIPIKHITHSIDYGNSCINKIKDALIEINKCYDTFNNIQSNVSTISKIEIEKLINKISENNENTIDDLPHNKEEELKNLIERITREEYKDLEIAIRDKEIRQVLSDLLNKYLTELDLKQFRSPDNLEFIGELYGEDPKGFLIDKFKFTPEEITDELGDNALGTYKWSGLILIYLDVIYAFASRYKLNPYFLYRKVLIHELAHAFHHRGFDADGGIWDSFGKPYPDRIKVVEGLANWHCMHYMIKLDVESSSVENLYTLLCCSKVQPKAYSQFIKWTAFSYENIRNRIYHARNVNPGKLSFKYFNDELEKCHLEGE